MSLRTNKVLKCDSKGERKEFVPQYHQLRVTKEFINSNKRGMLLYHALGSGKTCAAYLAIDLYRKTKGKRPVYILAPASLASSHKHQYCDVCGDDRNAFNNEFKFYSYNDRAGIAKRLPANLNDSIIIVDEVQEVVNGKGNKSASLVAVYDKVFRSERSKVILLSGTPIFTEYHLSLILNLLEPGIVSMDETTFMAAIRSETYLFEKCKGLISYVPIPNPELYPTRVLPDIVDIIPMSRYQFSQYYLVREDERAKMKVRREQIDKALRAGNMALAKKLKIMLFINSTKLLSRQLCNFAYPEDIKNSDDLNADWILNDPEDIHVKNLKIYSGKMALLVKRILTIPNKHMVYAWYKTHFGLYLIYTYLVHCGLEPLIFSGDLGTDEKRAAVINQFNAENNARGEKNKVILVSGAGAMGISLFGIRHLHVFEASINEFITLQAEGRAFRTYSHHQLPEAERNVQVYRYFSSLPKDEFGRVISLDGEAYPEQLSSEQQMYEQGIQKMKAVERVLDIMKRSAFDCRENYNHAIKNCYDYTENIPQDSDEFDFEESPYIVEEDKEMKV